MCACILWLFFKFIYGRINAVWNRWKYSNPLSRMVDTHVMSKVTARTWSTWEKRTFIFFFARFIITKCIQYMYTWYINYTKVKRDNHPLSCVVYFYVKLTIRMCEEMILLWNNCYVLFAWKRFQVRCRKMLHTLVASASIPLT